MVDPEAMEAAMAEETFLQETEEGEMMDKGRRVTSTDLGGTTPTGTVMAVATTTRDERGDGPQRPGEANQATRQRPQDIGEEREKR